MSSERLVTEDYRQFCYVAEPDYSKSRDEVAYSVRRWEKNEYICEIHVKSQEEKIVTAGGSREFQPLYSPDGKCLAFLGNASGQVRVWLWKGQAPVMAGEDLPREFTVTEYLWMPDGKKLLLSGYCRTDQKETPQQWLDPHIGEGESYRKEADGGWKENREYGLWLVDSAEEKSRCIYRTRERLASLYVSEDGKRIWWNKEGFGGQYCSLKTGQKEPDSLGKLAAPMGSALVQLSEDGDVLAAGISVSEMGKHGLFGYGLTCFRYGKSNAAPEEVPLKMLGDVPDELLPFESIGSPFPERNKQLIHLGGDKPSFGVIGVKKGAEAVYVFQKDEDSITWRRLTDGTGTFHAICPGREGFLYGVRSDMAHPYELVEISLQDGSVTAAADNNPWIRKKQTAQVVSYCTPSLDGKTTLYGRILAPSDHGRQEETARALGTQESRKYPVVLLVHGGPTSFYADEFSMEAQLLAAAGFAVVMANPRGSAGYGREHAENSLAYDGTAYQDLLYFLDRALGEFSWMDQEHMAVAGGSYGGYMAAWMAGHCKRFQAAVVMRGLLNFQFLTMTSEAAGEPHMFDSPESFEEFMMEQMKNSPTSYADRMDIPMLIMHGEEDACCPVYGAHQLYVGVKDTHPDLPVRMILFPKTGHNIRSARLDYYEQYEKELIRWLVTYLAKEEEHEGMDTAAF